MFGWRSDEAIGRHCYEVIAGKDVFGSRFCYQACPVAVMARHEEPIRGFEMEICSEDGATTTLQFTVIRLPGPRTDLFTLVHMLHPVVVRRRSSGREDEMEITGTTRIADLAVEFPATIRVFRAHGIDFCCGDSGRSPRPARRRVWPSTP